MRENGVADKVLATIVSREKSHFSRLKEDPTVFVDPATGRLFRELPKRASQLPY